MTVTVMVIVAATCMLKQQQSLSPWQQQAIGSSADVKMMVIAASYPGVHLLRELLEAALPGTTCRGQVLPGTQLERGQFVEVFNSVCV